MRSGLLRMVIGFVAALGMAACDGGETDERPVGAMDALAMESCTAIEGTATPLTAAADAASAGGAAIHLSDTPYLVTLPASGAGYAVVHTEEMHTTFGLFVRERGAIAALEGPGLGESRQHGICPDALGEDYRVHIHEPGAYAITFAADAPREVMVLALLGEVGHPPGDGGAHHDHDGGAAHDHDGGAAHDHDGGVAHDHDGGH